MKWESKRERESERRKKCLLKIEKRIRKLSYMGERKRKCEEERSEGYAELCYMMLERGYTR
jgi:hypothetical protein